MARHRDAPHRISWEQLSLVKPAMIRLDLVIHLDGPSGTAQYSIERRDGLEQARVSCNVVPHRGLDSVGPVAAAELLATLRLALEDLSPF